MGIMALSGVGQSLADEGMWLFTNPPKKILKEKYGFESTPEWLDHVQKSSVRFNSGGSGSFVSPNGLVMTNHHVGADALQKFGDATHNYLKDGFYAKSNDEEKKCLDLELNVLMNIVDVTDRVNAAVKPDMKPAEAFAARRQVIADISKESTEKTGLRSDVVTLYQGGQYHLYQFKKYTDVRLVFAPEQQIAFYGGDPDNFEYPRFDFDICLFRVYEDGKPAKIDNYLKWSSHGAEDGELIFVSGHPGRTNRLNTVAELEYLRDQQMPRTLQMLNRMEVMLMSYSGRSEENARRARELLFGAQNSRKARLGGLEGLQDPTLMANKKKAEAALREAAAKDPKLKDVLTAWERIEKANKVANDNNKEMNMLENGRAFNSTLFGIARELVRAAEEKAKPNGQRLREFSDANLASLEFQLFSEEPLYDDFEQLKLANSLSLLSETLGGNSPIVQKILAGKSPKERATELISGSKLKSVELRKKLYEGGKDAIAASDDPMIVLARLIDPESRAIRKIFETEVEEVKRQAYAAIAKAKFAIEGTGTYPDATFTLRLSFGTVKGYKENGQSVPFETTFAGLYERAAEHKNKEPFDLPARWEKRKDKLDLKTPFNFVCTADIIGGNSGSPVINKNGEVVGLIFDGNIQSLVLDYAYTETEARAVAVHSAGIIEALRKVYDADDLADELTGKKTSKGKTEGKLNAKPVERK
jgi:hypothetical protein